MWARTERPEDDRVLLGVCAGLSESLGIDVTLLRLAFLVLVFASGLGLVLYVGLWLTLPISYRRAGSLKEVVQANLRSLGDELSDIGQRAQGAWTRTGGGSWPRPVGRRWIALGAIALGSALLLWSFGLFAWMTTTRAIGLAAIAIGAGALISLTGGGNRR